MNRFPLRRHELALVGLVLIIVALVAFWFGRATAPDRTLAYDEGKREGARMERRRHQQSLTELEMLKAEAAAASSRPRKATDPASVSGNSIEEPAAGEAASERDANN